MDGDRHEHPPLPERDRDRRSLARRVLGEPTLHFAVLAAALFGVGALSSGNEGEVIEIDALEVETRIAEIEAANGIALTPDEREAVREAIVDEQVLFREALARGLEDDPRVTDFLVQKMLHVLSGDVIQATDAQLSAFYEANRARYTPAPALTVDEIVLATSDPLPAALAARLAEGTDAGELDSELIVRHALLENVTPASLRNVFGEETAAMILAVPAGAWVGPHASVRGQHWFRVVDRQAPTSPPLDSIRDIVRLDWIAEREEALLTERVRALREDYRIVVTGAEGEP